jgi:hypothetical protein
MNRCVVATALCSCLSLLSIDSLAADFACTGGARLVEQPGDNNRAFNTIAVSPAREQHAALTRDAPVWLAKITGPASVNTILQIPGKPSILVLSWCAPRECDTRSALAAVDGIHYGIEVMDNGKASTLGTLSADAKSAIVCARAYHESRKWKN